MNTNNAFLRTNRTNRFHNQKFGLKLITSRRNGLPIGSTPISTQNHKRPFFSTLSALGLLHCGLGITLDNFQQHFIRCFDLKSTQQAAHDFLHPELSKCSVSLDLQFSNGLTATWKLLFGVYAHPMYSLHPTAKSQRTSFQFRLSENG